VRDKNIGLQVFANMDGAELRHALVYKIFDLLLFDDNSRDWNSEVFELYNERSESYKKSYYESFENRDKSKKLSYELEDFVGKYSNDMYGDIIVTLLKRDGKKSRKKYYLNLDVNNNIKNFDLEWWEGNTFLTDKDEKWLEKLFVDFKEEDGSIKSLKIYNVQFDKVSN
ncbi:MAG: DUF3471 domain-containing protein, partial [Bacteroidota bacterium]|nr:DUF3471 domain-containing protein [Bacteroidota bacterium]